MLKTFIRIFLSIWLFSQSAFSQLNDSLSKRPFPGQPHKELGGNLCGTDLLINNLRNSAAYLKAEEKMNRQIAEAVRLLDDDSTVLPVVFHILADDPFSIPDQVILDGLAALNDAFAKRGAWSASKGVDTKIRFCLAKKDPEGGNTTGITRVETYWGNHVNPPIEDAKMKATAQWDPSRYINIWFVRSIDEEAIAEFSCGKWIRVGVAGYATMPPGGGARDGIVITGFGHLLAHEMGHYLGLYHTFEGYCFNNNCLLNGDRVCDTPPDGSWRASSCSSPENSCDTDTLSNYSNGNFPKDVPDPIDNIMDYGDPSCQFTFTQGQADRMLNAINTQRSGLLEAKCEPPCTDNVLAGFHRSIIHPVQGDKVEFTNTSTGAVTFQWFVDGAQVSTTQDFTYTFNERGRFRVTLKAFKDNNCFGSYSEYVLVNCGVAARFYTNKLRIASEKGFYEDTILFTNNSYNATDFTWLVGHDKGMPEQVVSTSRDLAYIFDVPANYTFRLIASNGQCIDTTLTYNVAVQNPRSDGTAHFNVMHCYEQTKIKIDFFVCNNGYDTIPANTPISFYNSDPRLAGAKKIGATFYMPDMLLGNCCGRVYTQIIDVGAPGLNEVWMVFNDNGTAIPIQLPNTSTIERDYTNNTSVSRGFQMNAVPIPASAIMEPGDTLRLSVNAGPTAISSYLWSPPDRLSCTGCRSPNYIADTTRTTTKRVIATSIYGCYDTAYVTITVPPYHDFRVKIDSAECAGTDSIHIAFTVFNDFKRPVLPKGLTIRFYNGDPQTGSAAWLPPSFILSDTIKAGSAGFVTRIKAMPNGALYAVVNDSIGNPPIVLPNTRLEERNYLNNAVRVDYSPESLQLSPSDTTVTRGASFPVHILNTLDNAASTRWQSGIGYSLNCTACISPVVSATQFSVIAVESLNRYGCILKGMLTVKILPPDFTVSITQTECIDNQTTRVRFTICMNNGYDSVWKGIPVTFYGGNPSQQGSMILQPVFLTPSLQLGACFTYEHTILSPRVNALFAVVNDRGNAATPGADTAFAETNTTNNIAEAIGFKRFAVSILPGDTTIDRAGSVTLITIAEGGLLQSVRWTANPFLSCTDCVNPFVTPTYTDRYYATGQNENQCTDTAFAIVRTVTTGDLFIPDAFTANNDRLNDIFYVMGSEGVEILNDFMIYTRWGDKVFEAHNIPPNDPVFGWNGMNKGTKATPGVYVYQVLATMKDGKTIVRKGTVTLIR